MTGEQEKDRQGIERAKAINRREGEQQETGRVEEKKEKENKKNRRTTLG